MKTITARTMELKGSSYEIGRALGRMISAVLPLKNAYTAGFHGFTTKELAEAQKLFEEWCPGLNEELAGFADETGTAQENVIYYAMTWLHPNCSQIALLPSMTENGHPLLARNYEFNDELEDFTLIKTCVNGKYTHMGTSVLSFGRDDGFNEHGLAITMSSCGFPVGASKEMRRPALTGLQFWAVIRTLLENCRDTKEALLFLKGMPIAFNLNMILLDRSGDGALVETLDGRMAVRRFDGTSQPPYCHAANHAVIDELIPYEPQAMAHSLKRYDYVKRRLDGGSIMSTEQIKAMLLSPYPEGLCCHYYGDFFGTTKSMVIDPEDGKIEICWGGRAENGWNAYHLADPLPFSERTISLLSEPASPSLFKQQTIREGEQNDQTSRMARRTERPDEQNGQTSRHQTDEEPCHGLFKSIGICHHVH